MKLPYIFTVGGGGKIGRDCLNLPQCGAKLPLKNLHLFPVVLLMGGVRHTIDSTLYLPLINSNAIFIILSSFSPFGEGGWGFC